MLESIYQNESSDFAFFLVAVVVLLIFVGWMNRLISIHNTIRVLGLTLTLTQGIAKSQET